MANNETTTKFKVDISELKSGLQQARKETALASSEFKKIASGMDDWKSSTEGVEAKLKQLHSNLGSQKRVLAEYERTLEQVKAEYGENSQEAMEWQTKVNNQQAVVNRTEREIAKYENALEELTGAERSAGSSADDLGDDLVEAANKAEKSGDGFTVLKGVLANLVTDGIRMATEGLKNFVTDGIETASDLTEVQNVIDTTFGNSAQSIYDFSETASEQFGLTSLEAQKFAGSLGASLKASGLEKNADEMSMTLTGLAGDLASFYNLSADESYAKIFSGIISGETEPLKSLGVVMSQTNLQDFAMKEQLGDYSKMSNAEKTMTRYKYLLEVTSDAQGDFAKTSDSYANQQKILAMNLGNLGSQLGQMLLPTLTKLVQFLNDSIIPALRELPEKLKELAPIITVIAGGITALALATLVGNIGAVIGVLKTAIMTSKLMATAQAVLNAVMMANPIILIVGLLATLVGALIVAYKTNDKFRAVVDKAWSKIKAIFTTVVKTIVNLFKTLPNKIKGSLNTLINMIKQLPSKIGNVGLDLVRGIWRGMSNGLGWIKSRIKGWVGNVTSFLKKLFKINSPSKLMADEIGQYIPSGIAMGIEGNTKPLYDTMRNVTAGVVTNLGNGITTQGIGGGVVNNFNQTINSPRQLSRLEIYRQSKNLLGYAGGTV